MATEEIIDSGFAAPVTVRSNQQRGKSLIISLWVSLGTSVASLISLLLMFFILNRGFSGYDAHFDLFQTYSLFAAISGGLSVIANILVIVFWILWMRRAYYNLHALHLKDLAYSEGMAAGGWFIPIFSFWIPAQIMSDIWRRTQERVIANKRLIENGAIVGIWWTLFLLERLGGAALDVIVRIDEAKFNSNNVQQMYGMLKGQVIIELVIILFFTIPLTFAAIVMVKKSTKMQNLLYLKEKGEEITTEMITGS